MVSYGMKMINREAVDVQMRMGFDEKNQSWLFHRSEQRTDFLSLNKKILSSTQLFPLSGINSRNNLTYCCLQNYHCTTSQKLQNWEITNFYRFASPFSFCDNLPSFRVVCVIVCTISWMAFWVTEKWERKLSSPYRLQTMLGMWVNKTKKESVCVCVCECGTTNKLKQLGNFAAKPAKEWSCKMVEKWSWGSNWGKLFLCTAL